MCTLSREKKTDGQTWTEDGLRLDTIEPLHLTSMQVQQNFYSHVPDDKTHRHTSSRKAGRQRQAGYTKSSGCYVMIRRTFYNDNDDFHTIKMVFSYVKYTINHYNQIMIQECM